MTFSKLIRRPISAEEEHILREFARFMSGLRSAASIAAYQSDIRLFAENTPGVDLLQITEAQEDNYIAALYQRRIKETTLQRKSTAFRYFRDFVASRGLRGKSLHVAGQVEGSKDKYSVPGLFNSGKTIDKVLKAFLQELAEDHSQSTVRAYTNDLLKFRKHLHRKANWQHVSKQLISDFIDEQVAAGLHANSAARLLSTIRSLFRWLQQNGHVVGTPTQGLQVPRAGKHPHVPSLKELAVLDSARLPSTFPALRARLLFELLSKCGLRISEISALDTSSVDLTQRRLTIRGRHDRQRYVDIQESTANTFQHYLAARREIVEATLGPLLVNLRGGRLTVRSIARVIEQLVASGVLPEGTHPHLLRYAYASHSLRDGKNMQDIRHDLGVSGISAVLKISG